MKNICTIIAAIILGVAPVTAQEYIYKAEAVDAEIVEIDGRKELRGESVFALDNHFVWGGTTIRGEDGKYYLIYSTMDAGVHPFNNAWVYGSKLGVAVSDRPDGGFRQVGIFYNKDGYAADTSRWDAQSVSNPHIRRFGDKYYLYYIGASDPGNGNIRSDSDTLPLRDRVQQSLKTGVMVFDSFDGLMAGDFTVFDRPLLTPRTRVKPNNIVAPSPEGVRPLPDNIITVNPSIVYRPLDGKYLLYFKGNMYDPTWRGVHGVAIGDRPEGPFVPQDFEVFSFDNPDGTKLSAEDPYVWYCPADKLFYAIFKDFTGHFTKGEPAIAIMYSEDGIDWKLPENSMFMKKEVRLSSGETIKVSRLERPQLYLDENGVPTVLYAACSVVDVNPRKDGGSFNIQIRLKRTPAKQ